MHNIGSSIKLMLASKHSVRLKLMLASKHSVTLTYCIKLHFYIPGFT